MTNRSLELMEKIKTSKYFDVILTNNGRLTKDDIVGAYVGGSRICENDTDSSDIDIVVITRSYKNFRPTETLRVDNVLAHWYYIPYNLFIHADIAKYTNLLVGQMWLRYLTLDAILYIQDESLINKLFELKDKISFCGGYDLCKSLNATIAIANYQNELSCDNMKLIHYLAIFYYHEIEQEIDWDLINCIKYHITENTDKALEILHNLGSYLINQKPDLTNKYEEYNKIFNENRIDS